MGGTSSKSPPTVHAPSPAESTTSFVVAGGSLIPPLTSSSSVSAPTLHPIEHILTHPGPLETLTYFSITPNDLSCGLFCVNPAVIFKAPPGQVSMHTRLTQVIHVSDQMQCVTSVWTWMNVLNWSSDGCSVDPVQRNWK